MIREVAFYNQCNNGDIHVSRELVKYTMKVAREKYPSAVFTYYHRNSPRLTADIDGLEHRALTDMPKVLVASDVRSFGHGDGIYINTWYASSPIFKSMGCTLNTLHELFRANLKEWFGHDLDPDVSKFLPTYNAWKLNVSGVEQYMSAWLAPSNVELRAGCVLLCNGQPMSGQTNMPPGHFEQAMQSVIDAHRDKIFIVTNPEVHQFTGDNVVFARDVIDVDGCDLPEIAFMSNFCDIIIGRGSGPYSFSLTAQNLGCRVITFICFTDDRRVADWVYMTDAVKAKIVWSNNYDVENMRSIVSNVMMQEKTR